VGTVAGQNALPYLEAHGKLAQPSVPLPGDDLSPTIREATVMAKNHYLAKCYLSGFSTPGNPEAIWQYRKSTCVLRKRGIHKVACLPNYYALWLRGDKIDDSVERFFGGLETQWPFIRRVLDDLVRRTNTKADVRLPTREQKAVLLQFMLIHAIRTRGLIESMQEYVYAKHPLAEQLNKREAQNIIIRDLPSQPHQLVHPSPRGACQR